MAPHDEPSPDRSATWARCVRRWLRLGGGEPRHAATAATASPSTSTRRMPFLGPDQFLPGSYTPKLKGTTTGGRATSRGTIVCTNLERELVNAILPPDSELELARNSVAPDLHPVISLYGHPEQTSWIVDDQEQLHGADYCELMLLVPFVQNGQARPWHTYARAHVSGQRRRHPDRERILRLRQGVRDATGAARRPADPRGVRVRPARCLEIPGTDPSQAGLALERPGRRHTPNYEAIQTVLGDAGRRLATTVGPACLLVFRTELPGRHGDAGGEHARVSRSVRARNVGLAAPGVAVERRGRSLCGHRHRVADRRSSGSRLSLLTGRACAAATRPSRASSNRPLTRPGR